MDFKKSKACEENLACKLFELTLQMELLKCEERKLISEYNANQKTLKRVKLNYIPVVEPATDNPTILLWVNEAKITLVVPASHMNTLDRSIEQKLKQNASERRASYEEAKR